MVGLSSVSNCFLTRCLGIKFFLLYLFFYMWRNFKMWKTPMEECYSKSNTPSWVFFTFLKIVQIVTDCVKHHIYLKTLQKPAWDKVNKWNFLFTIFMGEIVIRNLLCFSKEMVLYSESQGLFPIFYYSNLLFRKYHFENSFSKQL